MIASFTIDTTLPWTVRLEHKISNPAGEALAERDMTNQTRGEYHRSGHGPYREITYSKDFVDLHPSEAFIELDNGRFLRDTAKTKEFDATKFRSWPMKWDRCIEGSRHTHVQTMGKRAPKKGSTRGIVSWRREEAPRYSRNGYYTRRSNPPTTAFGTRCRPKPGLYALTEQELYPNPGHPQKQMYPERCTHDGTCGKSCLCVLNMAPCRLSCECTLDCSRRFPPCKCTGRCGDCACKTFGWACLPGVCSCADCDNTYLLSTVPKDFVSKSTIPGAGSGLFAMEDIAKGTYLGDYQGKVVNLSAPTQSRVSIFATSGGKYTGISRPLYLY